MGNQASAHQPLERGFRRAASFRFSKRERSGQGPGKRMDRIRRSFRDSFRRRRDQHSPEASRPHQWQADESAVRSGNCAFQVKYLGCTEVTESRGMQTCEEALKTLRSSRRRPIRAILNVSGDGLRVVDDETKDLIVDQTIEKVSFCAPDRNCEKGFSYICRDGTTRRWMCHGFLAVKESGDRLSHAVGCAFAACLERKQRRDKECGVTMTFDQRTSAFTRTGSFRQSSLTERMDSQERAIDVPPARQIHNPYAIERPHATPSMLERQGSFRGFDQLNHASPFKRQLSLRVNDLPSNYERVRSHSLEPTDLSRLPSILSHQQIPTRPPVSPIPEISPSGQDSVSALCQQVTRDLSILSSDDFGSVVRSTTNRFNISSTMTTTTTNIIPGVSSSSSLDNLRLTNGFVELSSSKNNNGSGAKAGNANNNNNNNINNNNKNNNNDADDNRLVRGEGPSWQDSSSSSVVSSVANARLTPILNQCCPSLSPVLPRNNLSSTPPHGPSNAIPSIFDTPAASPVFSTTSTSSLASSSNVAANQLLNRSPVQAPQLSSSLQATLGDSPRSLPSSSSPSPAQLSTTPVPTSAPTPIPAPVPTSAPTFVTAPIVSSTDISATAASETAQTRPTPPVASVQPVLNTTDLPKPEQWLGSVTTQASVPPPIAPRRAPPLHARAMSLGSAVTNPSTARQGPADPFDSAWVDTVARKQTSTTNPFILPNTTQAFQVQL